MEDLPAVFKRPVVFVDGVPGCKHETCEPEKLESFDEEKIRNDNRREKVLHMNEYDDKYSEGLYDIKEKEPFHIQTLQEYFHIETTLYFLVGIL